MTTKSQDAFEAWHSKYYGCSEHAYRLVDGDYILNSVREEFVAFDAGLEYGRKQALEEQATEIAELKAKLEDAMDALKKYDELIKHNYSGTQEAMSDLTYAAQNGHSVLLKLAKD
jgi:hypothetical protein